ncbi:hypothetical protein HZC31_00845 [Candidatus Woesearchaeota archaeon]|nr:hypothetical protein [Candidatus Woesearchaeota archaeon]
MKSYALAFFLILLLLVAGCGTETVEETTSETPSETTETTSQTVDDVTNVDTVEEDLSVNDEEDDYGDII